MAGRSAGLDSFMSDEDLPPIEARKSLRKRVLLGGIVVYNEGAFSTQCRIRDISEGGARIQLSGGQVIPTRVVLVDTRNRSAHVAEVMWFRPPEAGLRFLSSHQLASELPAHLHYLKGYA